MHDKMAVISSAFESSLSLSAYVQLAYYLDRQNLMLSGIKNNGPTGVIAHGLGTYKWLKEDVSDKGLRICVPPHGDKIEASVKDAHKFLQHLQIKNERIQRSYSEQKLKSYYVDIDGNDLSCRFKLQEAGTNTNNKTVIFLHGFLGTSEDWVPIIKAISCSARAIAVDLPGHGESQLKWHKDKHSISEITVKSVADLLLKLICHTTDGEVLLVGYSMGARIALQMALSHHQKISGAVIISGSPGLKDEASRRLRSAQDESRAQFLLSYGLECFLETWYSGKIWDSLREHPHFQTIVSRRSKHKDIKALAKTLHESSVGRQMSLWEDLKHLKKPLLLIAGEKDKKFKEISQQMWQEIRCNLESKNGDSRRDDLCEMIVVPESGHAVHVENPLPVIRAVRKFLMKL